MTLARLDIVSFGIVLVVVATLVLLVMVHRELGPLSGLARQRHWLLAGALGTGVFAFAAKILLIVVLAHTTRSAGVTAAGETKLHPPAAARVALAHPAARYRWLALPTAPYAPRQDATVAAAGYVWQALPEQPLGDGDPVSRARIALGERLFFDRRLSRDGTLSCSSCHDVRSGAGGDGLPTALGIDHQVGRRNTPTVWNAALQARLFWDGRAASLEEQAKGPLLNPAEMGMPSLEAVVQRVAAEPAYREAFGESFPGEGSINIGQVVSAIAAYERTLITADTPYDRFVRGELHALSPSQLRGMALFASLGCISCHTDPSFSGASRFNGSAPLRIFPAIATPYEVRYRLTEDSGAAAPGSGRGVWRIPSLRNVALTAPYFHNGSVATLEEAVRVMASVQLGHTGHLLIWSDDDKTVREMTGAPLSDDEINDLTAFLHALSSDTIVARMAQAAVQKTAIVRYAAN